MVYLPEEKLLIQSDIVNTNNPLPAMPTRDQQTLLTEVTRFEAGCRAGSADPWQADPVERLREDLPAADSQCPVSFTPGARRIDATADANDRRRQPVTPGHGAWNGRLCWQQWSGCWRSDCRSCRILCEVDIGSGHLAPRGPSLRAVPRVREETTVRGTPIGPIVSVGCTLRPDSF